jgi:hypothetical protein
MRASPNPAVTVLLTLVVVVGPALPRGAAARPAPGLVPATDAKLGASILAPAGWLVRFGRPGSATLAGTDARIEVQVAALEPGKPPAALVHSRIGLPPKRLGAWTCGRIVRPTWAQALCAKALGQQVLSVFYDAEHDGREGDARLLIRIGESAKGFDPGRVDPRDERGKPVKLVARTVGQLTVLGPEDWTANLLDDGTLALQAPARDESVVLSAVATGALDEAGAVSLSAGADEVTRPEGWLCFRKAGSAACHHVRADRAVDLTVTARMADEAAARWIVGALPAIGASVDREGLVGARPGTRPQRR